MKRPVVYAYLSPGGLRHAHAQSKKSGLSLSAYVEALIQSDRRRRKKK